jgi:two-component system cell cycle response regulator CtrA
MFLPTLRLGVIASLLCGLRRITMETLPIRGNATMIHAGERIARRHALLRSPQGHSRPVITTGKLAVNLDAKTVEVNGCRVHLTGKEYQVLELLSLRMGWSVTKEAFMDYLYSGMNEPKPKIIDVFICKLRKKLAAAAGADKYIETIWGHGHLLRDRVSEVAPTIWTLRPGSKLLVSGHP